MIDFDGIDDWTPELSDVLSQCVPDSFERRVADAAPEYVEDALDMIFASAGRDAVIDATLAWIRSSTVAGYHGSRLTDEEVASVRSNGLTPLVAEVRRDRLVRALSTHFRDGMRLQTDLSPPFETTDRVVLPVAVKGRRTSRSRGAV